MVIGAAPYEQFQSVIEDELEIFRNSVETKDKQAASPAIPNVR